MYSSLFFDLFYLQEEHGRSSCWYFLPMLTQMSRRPYCSIPLLCSLLTCNHNLFNDLVGCKLFVHFKCGTSRHIVHVILLSNLSFACIYFLKWKTRGHKVNLKLLDSEILLHARKISAMIQCWVLRLSWKRAKEEKNYSIIYIIL